MIMSCVFNLYLMKRNEMVNYKVGFAALIIVFCHYKINKPQYYITKTS